MIDDDDATVAPAGAEDAEMYRVAVELVVSTQLGSVSMLQRKLRIGYGRAHRLMTRMVDEGIVAPGDGATHARDVLVPADDLARALGMVADVPIDGMTVADEDLTDDGHLTDTDDDIDDDAPETAEQRAARLGMVRLDDLADVAGSPPAADRSVIITVHSSALAEVLAEAALFGDARDTAPLCWLELTVAGGWLHALATNRYVAGWSRSPLFDSDTSSVDQAASADRSAGWDRVNATAQLHIDDAKLLARAVKHRGKADLEDRAIVQFTPGAVTVERVDVEGQRDVRMTLTDYRGTMLEDRNVPIGLPAIDRLVADFRPSEEPIDPSLRVSSQLLAPFARVRDYGGDGTRVLFGPSRDDTGARLMLLRVGDTFSGLMNTRRTDGVEADHPTLGMDEVGPGEAGFRRAEVTE